MTPRAATLLASLLVCTACNSTTKPNGVTSLPPSAQASVAPASTGADLPALPPPIEADPREGIIARGLRELLEREHLRAHKIDDEISRKAFDRYIDRLDPGKLFLLEDHVKALSRYADRIDDQLRAGEFTLARVGAALIAERRNRVAALVAKLLEAPFDFSKPETLETDADKRKFAQDEAALEDRWRKSLKNQVLDRVARMQERLKDAEKGKQANRKSATTKKEDAEAIAKLLKETPKTFEAQEAKARSDLATTYAGRFKRLAKREPLEAVEACANAIAGVFDPHTLYLAPAEQANFDIQMSGSLEGIGAVLAEDDHYISVREIVPGGAAWRQGELEAGDLILAVTQAGGEPVDVADMRINEVVQMIRGPKGTLVTLTVKKPDDRVVTIQIKRDVIVVEASYARGALLKLGERGPRAGYIFLPSFYGNTRSAKGMTPERNATQDVRALLSRFSKVKDLGGVILDLRGNGGGLLNLATDITGLFIEQGPVVQVRASNGRIQVLKDDDPSVAFSGELVVLVDRFSASASEILAGALQDYSRALIVGTGPTHGKGTVQMLADFDRMLGRRGRPLGVLKLTVQQFFLVDGESTQRRGVQPDVTLPDPASFVESGERYLDNAIPWSAVQPLPHKPWQHRWDPEALEAASEARQAAEPVFATIDARAAYLRKREEDTTLPLERNAWFARREKDRTELEKLDPKLDEGPPRFQVQVVKYRPDPPPPKGGARADAGERIAKWRETLEHDPWVAEALHLLGDMSAAAPTQAAAAH